MIFSSQLKLANKLGINSHDLMCATSADWFFQNTDIVCSDEKEFESLAYAISEIYLKRDVSLAEIENNLIEISEQIKEPNEIIAELYKRYYF